MEVPTRLTEDGDFVKKVTLDENDNVIRKALEGITLEVDVSDK